MTPEQILMDEHRVIERVLSCLEKLTGRCQTRKRLDAESARQMIAFFRGYADRRHHGKEEDLLFPLMTERGVPTEGGPIGVMRYEHERGRDHITAMEQAIDGAAEGRQADLDAFIEEARGYIGMLREHIQKEDHCLFAISRQVLAAADRSTLMERFHEVDNRLIKEDEQAAFPRLAEELGRKFEVPHSDAPPSVPAAAKMTPDTI
jgi:hemerythrin-like domain-containing protein